MYLYFILLTRILDNERLQDEEGRDIPRRAGVSSFGFGGTCAHIVIEEAPEVSYVQPTNKPAYLMTLSAKTESSLQQMIKNLEGWLSQQTKINSLEDISYTLNVGRSHFARRCAWVVDSIEELQDSMRQVSEGKLPANVFMSVESKEQPRNQAIFKELFKALMQDITQIDKLSPSDYRDKLSALANFYAEGYELDWELLHQGESKQKISLPTYSFTKEKYWIPEGTFVEETTTIQSTVLHPLLDKNVSTLSAEIFTKVLTGNEFYLADHHVKGKAVLPGAAYIEMARAAGMLAMPDEHVVRLRNIIWERPIVMGTEPQTVTISLYPEENGVTFEVTTAVNENELQVHAQGKILTVASPVEPQALALGLIKARCLQHQNREDIYTYYRSMGLEYGPGFQVIQSLSSNEREVLAKIQLPAHLESGKEAFVLHPSLLDGALQATVGFMQEEHALSLPFSLGEIEIFGTLPSTCYVYASLLADKEKADLKKFQIQMVDESGKVKVVIKDFTVRVFREEGSEEKAQVYAYHPAWECKPITNESVALKGPIWVFDEESGLVDELRKQFPAESILPILLSAENDVTQVQRLKEEKGLPRYIIYRHPSEEEKVGAEILYPLFYLAQALSQEPLKDEIQVCCVNERESLFTQSLAAFAKTVRLEHPNLKYRVITLPDLKEKGITTLLSELSQSEIEVRYDKENKRWIKTYKEIIPPKESSSNILLKKYGVYLITGGAGGLGLIFARYLAQHYQAKLILTGRSALKEKQQSMLAELEKLGANVLYVRADVTKRKDLENVLKKIKQRFGFIKWRNSQCGCVT